MNLGLVKEDHFHSRLTLSMRKFAPAALVAGKMPALQLRQGNWTWDATEEAGQAVNDARHLKETLVKKGWKLGKDLKYFEAKR